MKHLLLSLPIFLFLFLLSPLVSSAEAQVGANINYTGLWRGSDGSRPGINAGTLPQNKRCKPKGYNFELMCGPATVSFEAMSDAYIAYAANYNKSKATKDKIFAKMPVGEGFRSDTQQKDCAARNPNCAKYQVNYPPPGHLWGTGIDFGQPPFGNSSTVEHKWLVANGPKYGWFWPPWASGGRGGQAGVVEPWHFNYYFVGHNPNSDTLESPFTGTVPGNTGGGGR